MSEDVAPPTSSSSRFLTLVVSESDFAKLRTSIRLRWFEVLSRWYVEDRLTYPLRRFLASNRFTYSAISWFLDVMRAKVLDLKKIDEGYDRSLKLLTSTQEDGYSVDSQFGYSEPEIHELSTLLNYKKQIDDGFPGPSESKQLYAHVIDTASRLIQETGSKAFFNFGVSYAYTDHILARKFPDVRFWGIERTVLPKLVNEVFFKSQVNMSFLAGDVFEYLRTNRFEGGYFTIREHCCFCRHLSL